MHKAILDLKGLERSGTGFCFQLIKRNLLGIEISEQTKHHFPDGTIQRRCLHCEKPFFTPSVTVVGEVRGAEVDCPNCERQAWDDSMMAQLLLGKGACVQDGVVRQSPVFEQPWGTFPMNEDKPKDNIILCIKNPYSWVLGFRDYARTVAVSLDNKVGDKIENIISLWNNFHKAWLNSGRNIFILRYEDILEEESFWIKNISEHFDIRQTNTFSKVEEYLNNYVWRGASRVFLASGGEVKFNRKDYFISKAYLEDLSKEETEIISSLIDEELLNEIGYTKEP